MDAHLPVNWADGSALHGLTATCEWTVVSDDAASVHLQVEALEGPYHVRGDQRFTLRDRALEQDLVVTNLADQPVPVGLGIHPWFRAGRIRIPAAKRWPGEPVATGEPPVPVTGADDLRSGGIPPLMDRCYTELTSTDADVPGVNLRWEGAIDHMVVYTGEPGFVAVEPVTMASGGIGLAQRGIPGHGVHVLEPGHEFGVRYTFAAP